MTTLRERMLIRRLQQRDERAFAEVMRLYQHKVYNVVFRMVGSREEAEDIAQEVFVTVFKHVDSFRGDAKFSTWMYRIVMRKAYDALDKRKRTPQPVDELPLTVVEPQIADRLDLDAALAQLEPDFRAAAVACDVVGLSMDEAAEVLGVPAGTVKSRLFRARDRLAVILDPERSS